MNDGSPMDGKPGFLHELEIMDGAENYNDWIFSQVKPFIGRDVLEVGCGIGTFTRRLVGEGRRVTALDLDQRCADMTKARCPGDRLEVHSMPAERVDELGRRFDTVLLINVLEHIADDLSFLSVLKNSLKGNLVIFVPAFSCLYGKTDSLVGHHRRYSRKGLQELVALAGFDVQVCRFFNFAGFFAWFLLNRVLRQPSNRSSNVNLYDRTVVPLMRKVESRISPPLGQSLFLVARSS